MHEFNILKRFHMGVFGKIIVCHPGARSRSASCDVIVTLCQEDSTWRHSFAYYASKHLRRGQDLQSNLESQTVWQDLSGS